MVVGIVGAGVSGLFTAYYLVREGFREVVVFEKKFPGSGSSYRCATGIRASFTSREHIELMKQAIELWSSFSSEHNVYYERGGYIWLLSREEDLEAFKKYVGFQNSLGVPTRIIEPDEVKGFVPSIDTNQLIAGVYDPLAGKACCFETVLALKKFLVENGVKIYTSTRVERIVVENGRVRKLVTSRGEYSVDKAVIAAGYGSREIASTAGLDLPLENLPRHALVTEKYRRHFNPLLIDWSSSSYIVQVKDGNFLIGAEVPEKPGNPLSNRIDFLYQAARVWTKYFKWLSNVNVLRYWTGYYVMTPDHHPILGPVEEIEGLYLATGFSGHGFMIAPATGLNLAYWILYDKPYNKIAENLTYERFKKGRLVKELAVFG